MRENDAACAMRTLHLLPPKLVPRPHRRQAAGYRETVKAGVGERPFLPVAQWHEAIGYPALAEAILDRLAHNAYKIIR
jgi:hypothetical protein